LVGDDLFGKPASTFPDHAPGAPVAIYQKFSLELACGGGMSEARPEPRPAFCPKCRAEMVDVVITPHPIVPRMKRHTFVCYPCNQTRTYMLASD
jgi:hypothetical protein